MLWDRLAWGHGSTRCQCPPQAQHGPGTAGTVGWQCPRGCGTAGARSAGAQDQHSGLGPCPCPRVPPASPPVPAPCPPGTVIVQLLHGRGRSPGAVCVSKGLCGKITQAEEEEEEEGESPPLLFTAMPGLWAQYLWLLSTGHPWGSLVLPVGLWHGAEGWHGMA